MEGILQSGRHPDPQLLSDDQRKVSVSLDPAADVFRQTLADALLSPGVTDVRAAVLDDLSQFYGLDPDECVRRCVDWEALSVDEWNASERESIAGLTEFYQTTTSWSFDLLWYGYLQTEGLAYPVQAMIAGSLRDAHVKSHLDFGSGVGLTSQMLHALGAQVTLADISTSMLTFARFRLERRGITAQYLDLNDVGLPTGRYDVITAIDTLAHVPSITDTARSLHAALRPGGLLFANFDVRPKTPENAWHLYDDDAPLRKGVQRAGFQMEEHLPYGIIRYRRVETGTVSHRLRSALDTVAYYPPVRRLARRAKRFLKR